MARKFTSFNLILLVLHAIMMIVALVVLSVSIKSFRDLMGKKKFLERSKDFTSFLLSMDPSAMEEHESQGLKLGPAIVIVEAVAATFLYSAFAFYFTLKKKIPALKAFVYMMSVALIIQLSASIWPLAVRRHFMEDISVTLNHNLKEYEVTPGQSAMDHPWDALQIEMDCCGVDGPQDYSNKGAIPLSCCETAGYTLTDASRGGNTGPSVKSAQTPYTCQTFRQNGCLEPLAEYFRRRLLLIGVLGISSTVLEVIVLLMTFVYTANYKRERMTARSGREHVLLIGVGGQERPITGNNETHPRR